MVFHHAATILVETVGLISLCPPALALMHFRTLQTRFFGLVGIYMVAV